MSVEQVTSAQGHRTNPLARECAAREAEQVEGDRANQLIEMRLTGGRPVLRIEGFQHSNLRTGAFE